MAHTPGKFVLVSGTGWTNAAKRRVARMIGRTLAEAGLGLVTGNSTSLPGYAAPAECKFPLPFLGGMTGNSDFAFQEILRTWDGHPVPGLSRTQFLRLAEPWVSGTGPLANLLRGTLAETPDIFISYRRSDAPTAAEVVVTIRGSAL